MSPKKRGRPKLKRKHLDEVESISHSDSTTNLNNQSESWQRPLSARKQIIPTSTRSLRSATRLIDNGITSLPRCSQPQISNSRVHSSATDDIKQLDVSANTVNSAYQVPKGSLVESPSRNLVHAAHSLTLEPEMGHKEAENIENSTMSIQEMMEEIGEAGKSLSNHSNQMDGHITFEAKSFPLEHEPLVGEIQASTKFEEITNKYGRKSISMVAMAADEDGDEVEVDSDTQSQPKDTINGYQVKPEFVPILRKIISKHGDIAKNCTEVSVKYRSMLLEIICVIISELDKKDVTKVKENVLRSKIGLVNGIKSMEMEVEWLHMRLVEILEARKILELFDTLKDKKDNNRKLIEMAENTLEECEAEKKEVLEMRSAICEREKAICGRETVCKEKLVKLKDESTKISQTVKYAKSKVRRFLNCSLLDGLI